jgi:hypothetical protein
MEFNERKFLKALYDNYKERNPTMAHTVEDWVFPNHPDKNNFLCKKYSFLLEKINGQTVLYSWTDEAERLGLISYPNGMRITMCFTDVGLEKAKNVAHPIRTFWGKHFQFVIGTFIAIVGVVCTVVFSN